MSGSMQMKNTEIAPMDNLQSDAITDFAAGKLSPAKHALMACALDINPVLAKAEGFETHVAASLMTEMRPVPLSPLLIGETLAKLPYRDGSDIPANDMMEEESASRLAPKSLRDLMQGAGLRDIKWKSLIPGIAVHDVLGNRRTRTGDRLYLLRAKAGIRMPEHSHEGDEWTLILTGSYVANDHRYRRGDLHISDETIDHAPHIDEGEDCICLVVTQAPLRMKSFFPRLVQQVVGI